MLLKEKMRIGTFLLIAIKIVLMVSIIISVVRLSLKGFSFGTRYASINI